MLTGQVKRGQIVVELREVDVFPGHRRVALCAVGTEPPLVDFGFGMAGDT